MKATDTTAISEIGKCGGARAGKDAVIDLHHIKWRNEQKNIDDDREDGKLNPNATEIVADAGRHGARFSRDIRIK